MSEFDTRIYDVVRHIPRGRVATYGQVALLAGYPGAARAVGSALHRNPYEGYVPCHRVVNATGRLSPHFAFGGPEIQRDLLAVEGIPATASHTTATSRHTATYHVDLSRYQWRP